MTNPNKPVRVFHNWKRGCFNVMQSGVVRLTAGEVLLRDVTFVVREIGRAHV